MVAVAWTQRRPVSMVISVSVERLSLKRKNIHCMHRMLAHTRSPKQQRRIIFVHEAKRQNLLQINSVRPCSAKPQAMKKDFVRPIPLRYRLLPPLAVTTSLKTFHITGGNVAAIYGQTYY